MTWIAIVGFAVFVVAIVMAVDASRRLLDVRVDQGRVLELEGKVPVELVHDVEDVLQRARASGRVVVQLESGRATVRVFGEIGEGTAQQLRNVVGRFSTARLRGARQVKR
jgi:Protein of unknown function (DUF3634)